MRGLAVTAAGTAALMVFGCSGTVEVGASATTSNDGRGVSMETTTGGQTPSKERTRASAEAKAEASVEVDFFSIPLDGANDVVFVLDRSGSMDGPATGLSGEGMSKAGGTLANLGASLANDAAGEPLPTKLEAAKAELVDALRELPDGTRVGVVFFSDRSVVLSDTLVALDDGSRKKAVEFVANVDPKGSTAAVPALEKAYTMEPRRVVFLSDGLANEEGDADTLLRAAREQMAESVRFDTVGTGLDQDAELLQTLAAESGGKAVIR